MSDTKTSILDPVEYWSEEVGRLQTLRTADAVELVRLRTAIAHLKEAVGSARATIELVYHAAGNEEYLDTDALTIINRQLQTLVNKADDLITPLAHETP